MRKNLIDDMRYCWYNAMRYFRLSVITSGRSDAISIAYPSSSRNVPYVLERPHIACFYWGVAKW